MRRRKRVHYETNAMPLIVAAAQPFDVGAHTLESFVLLHCAMHD